MQIGIIGVGRMGANICRLMKAGHDCAVFDTNAKPRDALAKEGAAAAGSLAETMRPLADKPRAIRMMLPGETKPNELAGHSAAQNAAE